MLQKVISFICCGDFPLLWNLETAITKLICTCMLWFNFILALNFILHCFKLIIIPKHNIYMYFWDIIVWQGKNQTSIRNSTTSSNRSRRLWFVVSLSVFTVYLSLTAKCTYLHVFQVWQIKPVIRDPVNVIVSQNTANHNT